MGHFPDRYLYLKKKFINNYFCLNDFWQKVHVVVKKCQCHYHLSSFQSKRFASFILSTMQFLQCEQKKIFNKKKKANKKKIREVENLPGCSAGCRRTTFSFRDLLHTLCKTNTNSDVNDQSTTSCSATDDEKSDDKNIKLTEKTCSPRYPDPVDYCEHIQGEIKRVQQSVATKSIAKHLTEDQLKEEREVQRRQLEEIFKLMQEQQDRFGIGTMDDMQEQLKLYAM
ncbi:hypothetical protein Btru_025335 [Bulinus truncatus]|nr:hypothetical protein Btru_025335 [Bulinus truncatus]